MFVCYPGCSEKLYKTLVKEDSNEMHTELHIPDMAPSDFEHLITYMYLGKITFGSVHELCFALYGAERFELHDLRIQCLRRLQRRIRENHSCAVELLDAKFKFSIVCENEQIFEEAVDVVKRNYEEVLTSDCINNISKNTMELLLHLEPDGDVEEIVVFGAVSKWSEAYRNRNELTGETLQKEVRDLVTAVQYNRIKVELIASDVKPSGLLDDKLCLSAFVSATGGSVDTRFGKKPEKLAALLNQVRQLQIQHNCLNLNKRGCVNEHAGDTFRNSNV